MQVDFFEDWQCWDNTEPCTLQSTAKTGSVQSIVPVTIKRAITTKELAQSMGAYQGSDVVWLVPNSLLTQNHVPQPGDVATDRDGAPFTVLSAQGIGRDAKGYAAWRLVSRNMIIAHSLRDLITIEAPVASLDGTATETKNWTPRYKGLAAKVELLSNETEDNRGIRGSAGVYAVYLAQEVDVVVSRDRLVWPAALGGYLDITGYRNRQRIDELSVLDCRQMV